MVDSLFLIAWGIAWIEFFIVVSKRSRWLAYISLVLGMSAVTFDFSENYYIGSALTSASPTASWFAQWKLYLALSYLLTFAGAAAGSLAFHKNIFTDISIITVGVLFAVAAAVSFFVDG